MINVFVGICVYALVSFRFLFRSSNFQQNKHEFYEPISATGISSSHVKAGLCLSSAVFFSPVLLYVSKKNVIIGYDYDEEYSIYCGFGWAPCFCNNNTDIGDLSANSRAACATIWLVVNHKFARDHVKIAFSPEHVHAFNIVSMARRTGKRKTSKQKSFYPFILALRHQYRTYAVFVMLRICAARKWRRAINWLRIFGV